MALRDTIQAYHDLLTDERAQQTQAQLDDQLHRRGLFFGERPLCTVLRPRFLTPEQYRFLKDRTRLVLSAFRKAYDAALADEAVRAQFGLLPWEEELIRLEPGFTAPSPTGRLDTFLSEDATVLKLVEYNAETPAAPAYNDVLTEVFLGLPVMRDFLRTHEVRPLPARHSVLHALLDAYEQWGGNVEPHIGILDWREVPTYSEHLLFSEYFGAQGIPAITVDPRNVEYRAGHLYAGDFPITLLYKRVLLSELIDRGGLDHPVVRAVRDGAVCMVNPFRCKILHKKASLAVLSDERNAHLFSADERQAIADHIPWTRVVAERKTDSPRVSLPSVVTPGPHGEHVDLVPYIAEHRERFVLKANDEYGGKGIYLGWETGAEEWERAIQTALSEPFVVQERVSVPQEPYPSMADGKLVIADRILDTAPFVFYGEYVDGALTRLSTAALVNVTAGGGSTVPTFVVEQR